MMWILPFTIWDCSCSISCICVADAGVRPLDFIIGSCMVRGGKLPKWWTCKAAIADAQLLGRREISST